MIETRSPTQQELAQRLRQARESAGLTQEDVAGRLDLSRSSVAQIELGKRAVSGLELDRLARLYGRDIRDFFAADLRPEESVIALFRTASMVAGREGVLDALRDCVVLARELAGLEGVLGIDRSQSAVPLYSHGPLRARWQAIEQGTRAALEERRRLGLGARPLGDLSELLEEQGIRTVMIDLPDEVSGLCLMEKGLSLSAIVNQRHSRLRRRFSWAHEYAHLLLDRDRQGTISLASDRDELSEIRANVFAACFLMPEEGVREFLTDLGKGRPRRERVEIFDEEAVIPAEIRTEPDAQAVRLYDVVLLAHHFKVSRTSMLYRLHNLRFLSQAALDPLLREEESGRGRDIERLLDLPQIDHAAGRNSFRSRFLGLALEAYRRAAITLAKLRELAALVSFSEREILGLLEDAGLSPDEGAEVLLPGDPNPII